MTMFIHRIKRTVYIKGQGINLKKDWHVVQTITSMSVGSTCRLHASQTLNLLPCICSNGIGEPGKLRTKAGCNSCISNLTFYKQWILQCPQRF